MSTTEATMQLNDYQRYGRQMILDGIGLPGQLKLQQASVVVVGAGGLGCPALQYLAAAGVGCIAIVDHDIVELSNLQRQILHTEARVGVPKAVSAAAALQQINSRVRLEPITAALTSANAMTLLAPYDLILDCTDNLPTRYLLSDTAVHLGLPLVSGGAQQLDGQLATYGLPPTGPCFRCLFPRAPAPETVGSCAELGVLGAVTGVVGTLQALEAIKIITGMHDGKPTLLIYSALGMPPFRSIKLRSRRNTCAACGEEGERVGAIDETDYVAFCGGARPDWEARGRVRSDADCRIRGPELKTVLNSRKVRVLDVRPRTEFGICHLPGSINVPIKDLTADPSAYIPPRGPGDDVENTLGVMETYVVCRLGNDSQIAVEALRSAGAPGLVKDLVGGLKAWSREVDPTFPVY